MVGDTYRAKEKIEMRVDWYGKIYGKATINEGDLFILEREPVPEKKLYKLREIPKGNYEPANVYFRKSEFNKYFEIVKEE